MSRDAPVKGVLGISFQGCLSRFPPVGVSHHRNVSLMDQEAKSPKSRGHPGSFILEKGKSAPCPQ